MSKKPDGVINLHDLEGKELWSAVLILAGLCLLAVGFSTLAKTLRTAIDQTSELSDRVEHLSKPVTLPSEPVKTSPS